MPRALSFSPSGVKHIEQNQDIKSELCEQVAQLSVSQLIYLECTVHFIVLNN